LIVSRNLENLVFLLPMWKVGDYTANIFRRKLVFMKTHTQILELWRSCRLVVDTGIHAKKWTRQEGIDYYKKNTPAAESACVKMVERHIVMPGQATAYKIGMNKILDLRENAKEQLGDKFDIKQFHNVVLTDGALPLTILESKVDSWVKSKKQ